MKYGILTYHNIPNIGAVLQAYALCTKLRQLGAECEIVDYRCKNIIEREIKEPAYGNSLKHLAYTLLIKPKQEMKICACQDFVRQYYSKEEFTHETIKKSNKEYDGFISGSDMIWNLEVNGNDFSYFLDFAEDSKKKFSYGSSVGESWAEESMKPICALLERYEYISVRESDTCDIIQNRFSLRCKTVCDPTMLLPVDEWDAFTGSVEEKNYVLVYFPYKNILNAAKAYAQKHQKKLVIAGTTWPWKSKSYKSVNSPQQWLSYIKNADAVFTDAYHGLLFSLYFHRPVWTDNHGNRNEDLLRALNLTDCFIENDPDFLNKIPYDLCDKKMGCMRKDAVEYLRDAIKES